MDLIDDDAIDLIHAYRFFKTGLLSLDVNKDPAIVCLGVRALMETNGNGRW